MKQILAFGDSNTWGLIPGSSSYERYGWGTRWTSVLQEKLPEAEVIENGLCGRTTVFDDEHRKGRKGISSLFGIVKNGSEFDAVIFMLGTNDCKTFYNNSPYAIGEGIEACLDVIEKNVDPQKIILVSPMHLGDDVWRPDKDPDFSKDSVRVSKELKDVYSNIARKRGNHFLAASDFVHPSEIDNEHMDEEGHRIFADVVYNKLQEIAAV